MIFSCIITVIHVIEYVIECLGITSVITRGWRVSNHIMGRVRPPEVISLLLEEHILLLFTFLHRHLTNR